jgi:hypothetical protein
MLFCYQCINPGTNMPIIIDWDIYQMLNEKDINYDVFAFINNFKKK